MCEEDKESEKELADTVGSRQKSVISFVLRG